MGKKKIKWIVDKWIKDDPFHEHLVEVDFDNKDEAIEYAEERSALINDVVVVHERTYSPFGFSTVQIYVGGAPPPFSIVRPKTGGKS